MAAVVVVEGAMFSSSTSAARRRPQLDDGAGLFNATLAAQFGIISFDHNNAYALW